jgi:hypothetical protein
MTGHRHRRGRLHHLRPKLAGDRPIRYMARSSRAAGHPSGRKICIMNATREMLWRNGDWELFSRRARTFQPGRPPHSDRSGPLPTRARAFVLGRFFRKISRHRACSVRPTALALLARPLRHGKPAFFQAANPPSISNAGSNPVGATTVRRSFCSRKTRPTWLSAEGSSRPI